MQGEARARAPVLAAQGGCEWPSEGPYLGGGGYYGPPTAHSSYSHRRSGSHEPRTENRSQQHWLHQARQAR